MRAKFFVALFTTAVLLALMPTTGFAQQPGAAQGKQGPGGGRAAPVILGPPAGVAPRWGSSPVVDGVAADRP